MNSQTGSADVPVRISEGRPRPECTAHFWRCLTLLTFLLLGTLTNAQTVTVGTKAFTESYVLGQIAKKVLDDAGVNTVLQENMGSTTIPWLALNQGSIDVYPEYTGTISEELLKKPGLNINEIRAELEKKGIGITGELGFNDSYGLVMKRERAEALGIKSMSDLAAHPELKAGPTHEFNGRKDGWGPLSKKYGFKLDDLREIDHQLGYAALDKGEIDIKDCYTTDAQIEKYDLKVLTDDKGFFPSYKAVYLYRESIPAAARQALKSIEGTIDETLMIKMNASAGETKSNAKAAEIYFETSSKMDVDIKEDSVASKIAANAWRHIQLVAISLVFAVLIGIPLGIAAAKTGIGSTLILGGTGVLQTIPSLALLAILVPITGTTTTTAIIALLLYSLLPIVRNTATGISTIAPSLRESAEALGLEPRARLTKIYLPLAMPTILAGIKTSAVINVGTATIAALIGVGGFGNPIVTGLQTDNHELVLQGAIPAAILAIVIQILFDGLERLVVPRGLRLPKA